MNHYCTYFDRGFLIQGLALWRSLAAHDPEASLWVLALDDDAAEALRTVGGPRLHLVTLAELEAGDAELLAAKGNRSRVEYYFTLSPCWPLWLLRLRPEIRRITYVDADMFFLGSPAEVFAAMETARASVLVTGHRFPSWLGHYERHGKFNVGLLCFANDPAVLDCLAGWRVGFDFSRRPVRLGRDFWRTLPLRAVFGGDWLRLGGMFFNLRVGLGRWSGQVLARLRTIFLRR